MKARRVFVPLPFYEGVAPAALPLEGATLAPVIAALGTALLALERVR